MNLPSQTQSSQTSVNTFLTTYKDTTISNGAGAQAIPNSGGSNLTTAMDSVNQEFEAYYDVASKIHEAAVQGATYTNSNELNDIKKQTSDAQAKIEEIKESIDEFAEKIYDFLN
jgi:gas vesicle protein